LKNHLFSIFGSISSAFCATTRSLAVV